MKKPALLFIYSVAVLLLIFFGGFWPQITKALTGKYAWSNQIGWINFNPDNGGFTVTDSAVTGYAWSESLGWINLSPSTQGIVNTTSGVLSGYAWGQNTGWINFSGVSINCGGNFTGSATGDVVGTINFTCNQCGVSTTWKPSGCSVGGGGGGGDTSPPPDNPPPSPPNPVPPPPEPTPPLPPEPVLPAPPTPSPPSEPAPSSAPSPPPSSASSSSSSSSGSGGVGSIVPEPVVSIPIPAFIAPLFEVEAIHQAATEVKKIVNTPAVSVATKTVSTIGAAGGMAVATSVAIFSPSSIFEIFLIPFRLLAIVMAGLGLKRKRVSWGVVYDSVTKQPLDPAYVLLQDPQGKDITSAITDLDGRYGFLAAPGIYQLVANKTNYAFPSQKLAGKMSDELYGNLYFGGPLEVKNMGDAIIKNIPLDPIKFDWNEFAKKNKNLMKFYSRWNSLFIKITNIFFVVGFIIAVVAFLAAPYPYNTIIVVFYLVLLLLRVLGLKPKAYGFIIDKVTKIPLPFAIIHIMDPDSNREITYKIADKYGRYYCLLPNGRYYAKIEKKQEDGSYASAYISAPIAIGKKGILKEKFVI